MKKKLLLACLIVLAFCTLGLMSCGLPGGDGDHTHSFGEWTTVTEPTCTTEGSKERVCSCGEKETETISATGIHSYGEWIILTQATCTTEGSKERVCSCGEKETETISATGHTFGTWTTVTEPTCTTEGSKERVCSCGEKETETISATGHTFGTWTTVTEPTCTTEGSKERVCSCGEKETETIPATGMHDFINGACSVCSKKQPTEGLRFVLSSDGSYYECAGMGTATATNIVIADFYNGKPVTSIGDYAFEGCTSLQGVTLGNGVTSIGDYAFAYCSSLQRVEYTGTIDQWAMIDFGDSSSNPLYYANHLYLYNETSGEFEEVTEVNLSTATYISDYAFYNAQSITKVTIGDSVTSIGNCAFYACDSLQSIVIPDSVTSIGSFAFYDCTSLQNILVDENNLNYKSIDGNLYSKDGKTLIQYAIGKTATEFIIPDTVTSIGDDAFYNCTLLESIVIPDSVTSIGYDAFYYCTSLQRVEYTGTIDQWAMIDFVNSSSNPLRYAKHLYLYNGTSGEFEEVTEVNLSTATYISDYAFYNAQSITKVTIGDSVTSIGNCAFYACDSLQSIVIPDSVTSIGDDAFDGCNSLQRVEYKGTIDQWAMIDFGVFSSNPLEYAKHLYLYNETSGEFEEVTEVNLTTATYISGVAFYNVQSITKVTIGDSVTSIGNDAFYYCTSLQSVTIGNRVTSIGGAAFYNCTSLQSVTIGNGVTSIGSRAFSGCTSLQSVEYTGTIDQWAMIYFGGYYSNPLEYAKHLYLYNETSGEFEEVTEVNLTTATYISGVAFYNAQSITKVTIGDSVTSIGNWAFGGCKYLQSIVIPDSVTSIGNSAFKGCTSLQNVYYTGRADEWNNISIDRYNSLLTNATRYYYSESEPALNGEGTAYDGNYWHYVDGVVTIWVKE